MVIGTLRVNSYDNYMSFVCDDPFKIFLDIHKLDIFMHTIFSGVLSSNHELTHKNSKADDSSFENRQDMTMELRVCRQTYLLSVHQIFFFFFYELPYFL